MILKELKKINISPGNWREYKQLNYSKTIFDLFLTFIHTQRFYININMQFEIPIEFIKLKTIVDKDGIKVIQNE